jgi:hypothetical protein
MEKTTQLNNTDKLLKAILLDDIQKFKTNQQQQRAIPKAS